MELTSNTNITKISEALLEKKSNSRKANQRKRNIISCLLISLHNGLAALSSLAVQFFLKDNLKLSPDQMASLKSILSIPSAIRPLLAIITDAFPICGYRRKGYIIISGMINLLVCLLISTVVSTYFQTAFCLFLYHLTFCFFAILCDAILIELSQSSGEHKEEVTKQMMGSFREVRTIGNIISSFLTGYLVENIALKQIFQISSILPILVIISGFMFTEVDSDTKVKKNRSSKTLNYKGEVAKDFKLKYIKKNSEVEAIKAVLIQIKHPKINKETLHNTLCKKLFRFLSNSRAIIPLSYMLFIYSLPAYSDTLFYYMVNELQLTPSEIGIANSIPLLFSLLTTMIYHKYLKEINYKTMMIIGTLSTYVVAGSILFLIYEYNINYGINSFYMIIIIQSLEIISSQLLFLPFSVFAVLICPPKLEATIYSICLGALQFGHCLSQFLGGVLSDYLMITCDNFDNLHLLIIIRQTMSICALPILCCINKTYFSPKKFQKEDRMNNTRRSSIE